MSSNTGNGDAGSDPNNVYPSLLSSNNFNPYTVSPYAPLTANQGGDNRNPEVDTIRAFSVPVIQVLASMNIASPNLFYINEQQILPNQIKDNITKAYVTGNSGISNAAFVVQMLTTDILAISSVEGTFQSEIGSGQPFTLNVLGQTNTQTLAVGPTTSVPAGYVAYIKGNVRVDGTIDSSGTFDISGLQVNTLGVKTLLDVSGESDLYGLVTAGNGINVTGNSYILGNVGIQKTNPTEALDVSGNIRVSKNLDVSGNAQITGNTYIGGNLDVSGTINLEDVTIIDAKVTDTLTVLGHIDTSGLYINYPYTGVPSGNTVMEVNGKSNFYNDMNISGGQLFVNASLTGNDFSVIRPILVINELGPNDSTARLEVNGFSNFLGSVYVQNDIDLSGTIRTVNEYVKNRLDVSGQVSVSGEYIQNNLDISGNLTVSGTTTFSNAQFQNLYVYNNLDVSGQIDTSGLYVYNNLDVSGNLNVTGTTTFGNAQFQNLYVYNNLDVSGQIDTSGLYVYNRLDVSGQIDTSGLYIYNNLDVSGNLNVTGTTTFGNAQFQNLYVYNNLDVSGQIDTSGLYVYNRLDVSGQIDTSGLYVYNNLDVSGNLNVTGTTTFGNAQFVNQYVQNKLDVSGQIDTSGLYVYNWLDVSGQIDTSGLYVYNNLDVSGNLNVTGTTMFGNAQFVNQYVQNKLDVSGQIDTSGLYVYNRLDVSGQIDTSGLYVYNRLDVSGQIDTSGLYVYNRLDVSGQIDTSGLYVYNRLDVSGQIDTSGLYVYNRLDVSGQIDTSGLYVYNRLDVSGQIDTSGLYVYNNLDVSGNTNIQGTTNYRIQVFDVDSTIITITDISNQPTIYVVDCNAGSLTVDLTTGSFVPSPLKVGVTYYFIARNTGAGNLQIKYNSLDTGLNPVTTAGVIAPLLITLVCVNYDGTDNFFSAST